MNRIERLLQILIIATVCLSGLLLGMGQNDYEPLIVAIFGAGSAWILVDRLRWFHLPQWLANILAIIVTFITVSNFYFTSDSVRHLLGVGKLLVYLQSILLFQRKSSRVYWQVLVLSLLQIVVGAVFNLGFEGGVLFILYMMVAGLSMMMLHLYQDRQAVRDRHREYLELATPGPADSRLSSRPLAVTGMPAGQRGLTRRMVGNFTLFAAGALVFAVFLFYFLPREHSSWSGPRETPMRVTGFSKKVSMNHPQMLLLSSRLEMNVKYTDPRTGRPFQPKTQPYLRGMALSNLRTTGNRTEWIAPPYQVFNNDFRPVESRRRSPGTVVQEIVLEPTEDPLLYTAMPPRMTRQQSPLDFDWCWPLGALTRQRATEKMAVSHFRYSLNVPVHPDGEFFRSWRYVPRAGRIALTPEDDPGNWKWLTFLDPQRYPTIVQVGQQLADEVNDDDHLLIAKRMEAYFLDEDRFTYTLDFRDLQRSQTLDTVEDFFANFRAGHCEYFASALTLMLRSQGIPARVVIGYRGGDLNEFGGHLDVESRHAHAWVEAYIRPGDCTPAMFQTRQAGPLGAWLRLDPTTMVDVESDMLAGADDALGYAKSFWRDYVLGLQAERSSSLISANGLKLSGVLRVLDLDWWQGSFRNISDNLQEPGGWKRYLPHLAGIALVGLVILVGWKLRSQRLPREKSGTAKAVPAAGWIRQGIGKLIGKVSPALASRLAGTSASHREVPFYSRMVKLLERAGFRRQPWQTHREFAREVSGQISGQISTGDSGENAGLPDEQIGVLAGTLTDFYYRVRFGLAKLDARQMAEVETALGDLEQRLRQRPQPPRS